jgi:endogenous inhibitor of DNA gyrase (YacG/DUF329 family)
MAASGGLPLRGVRVVSTPVTNSINQWRRASETERVRLYARGRVCAHPGCPTILSVYNPARFCAAHLQQARPRRRQISLVPHEVSCESCGTPFETSNPRRRYCSDRCRMAAFARRSRAQKRAERQGEALAAALAPDEDLLGSPA